MVATGGFVLSAAASRSVVAGTVVAVMAGLLGGRVVVPPAGVCPGPSETIAPGPPLRTALESCVGNGRPRTATSTGMT
ncbi:hypothetical protein GCM10009759_69580 [Kitasatospora saccharophila]|uniref:Secreted protein n=1 Tax=Kitasatospora saccharophila TaxID=407973 RepID=A0ABP5JNU8_9ACTN